MNSPTSEVSSGVAVGHRTDPVFARAGFEHRAFSGQAAVADVDDLVPGEDGFVDGVGDRHRGRRVVGDFDLRLGRWSDGHGEPTAVPVRSRRRRRCCRRSRRRRRRRRRNSRRRRRRRGRFRRSCNRRSRRCQVRRCRRCRPVRSRRRRRPLRFRSPLLHRDNWYSPPALPAAPPAPPGSPPVEPPPPPPAATMSGVFGRERHDVRFGADVGGAATATAAVAAAVESAFAAFGRGLAVAADLDVVGPARFDVQFPFHFRRFPTGRPVRFAAVASDGDELDLVDAGRHFEGLLFAGVFEDRSEGLGRGAATAAGPRRQSVRADRDHLISAERTPMDQEIKADSAEISGACGDRSRPAPGTDERAGTIEVGAPLQLLRGISSSSSSESTYQG